MYSADLLSIFSFCRPQTQCGLHGRKALPNADLPIPTYIRLRLVGHGAFGARTRVGSEKIEKSAKKIRWRKLGTIKTRSTADIRCDDAASDLSGVQIPIHRCEYRAKIRICNETVECDQQWPPKIFTENLRFFAFNRSASVRKWIPSYHFDSYR